jgi:hypothetical protein
MIRGIRGFSLKINDLGLTDVGDIARIAKIILK